MELECPDRKNYWNIFSKTVMMLMIMKKMFITLSSYYKNMQNNERGELSDKFKK